MSKLINNLFENFIDKIKNDEKPKWKKIEKTNKCSTQCLFSVEKTNRIEYEIDKNDGKNK